MRISTLISFSFVGLALFATLPAMAMDRAFPPNIKRGKMIPAPHPAVVIDGRSRMLAIGSHIWTTENLIEQPAALRGEDIVINYTETEQGEIDRIWILTQEEANQPIRTQQQQSTQ